MSEQDAHEEGYAQPIPSDAVGRQDLRENPDTKGSRR